MRLRGNEYKEIKTSRHSKKYQSISHDYDDLAKRWLKTRQDTLRRDVIALDLENVTITTGNTSNGMPVDCPVSGSSVPPVVGG